MKRKRRCGFFFFFCRSEESFRQFSHTGKIDNCVRDRAVHSPVVSAVANLQICLFCTITALIAAISFLFFTSLAHCAPHSRSWIAMNNCIQRATQHTSIVRRERSMLVSATSNKSHLRPCTESQKSVLLLPNENHSPSEHQHGAKWYPGQMLCWLFVLFQNLLLYCCSDLDFFLSCFYSPIQIRFNSKPNASAHCDCVLYLTECAYFRFDLSVFFFREQ